MSLRKKTISGLFWTFSQQFSVQFISFFISIVLARILSPAEFGLIAMISLFISVGNSLMDSGMTSSLIRTKDADQGDYSTVFFVNILASLLFYALLYMAAPYIATFYKQEILTNIIRVYSLIFIMQALVGVQYARLTKEMNFKTQMIIQIPSLIGGGGLGVWLAYNGQGVWSLVWMSILQSFLVAVQLWIFSGWRPDFVFSKAKFKKHFSFGYKMTLSGLLHTLYSNIYLLIIGKYYSAAQLGFYTRAVSIRDLPISNLSSALNKVTYPMFASISDDDKKLKGAYKTIMLQLVFWLTPTLIFGAIVAKPFFTILLTEKWLPAVPYFQILCFAGIIYPLANYNLNILKVKGRSDLHFRLEIIKKTYSVAGILFAVQYGIYGLLYFQVINYTLEFYVNSYYSGRLINYSFREQLADILPTLLIAIGIGIISWLFNSYLVKAFHLNNFLLIVIIGVFYSSLYFIISNAWRSAPINDFKQLVLNKNGS